MTKWVKVPAMLENNKARDIEQFLQGGSFLPLLEEALPTPNHPKYQEWKDYILLGVERASTYIEILRANQISIAGKKILDFGCGNGGLTVALAKGGATVTGIDISEQSINRAKALCRDYGVQADLSISLNYADEFSSESFDIIVCNDVIEHVDSFDRLARAHARLLRPNGVVVFNPPNRYSIVNLIRDPHYALFGISLLGQTLAEPYVTKIRKRSSTYGVNRLLGKHESHRIYKRAGITTICDTDREVMDNLTAVDPINARYCHPVIKFAKRIFPLSLIKFIIIYFIKDKWIFIGRKK